MIRIDRLRKCYDTLVAVDDISFDVNDGEIFGLLGPNGAGKTTTISMICGVLQPDGGRVLIDERNIWVEPKKVKRDLGVVPQEIAVYEDLTARDNLSFWGSLYMVMAAFGGCWWPLEIVSEPLQRLALIFPTGWAMRALHGTISFGLGLDGVLAPLAVLLGFAVVFSVIASRSLRID